MHRFTDINRNLMHMNLHRTSSIVRTLQDQNSVKGSGHVLFAETESFDKEIEDKLNQDDSDTDSAVHRAEKMTINPEDETTTQTSVGFKHRIFGGFFVNKKTSGRGFYSKFGKYMVLETKTQRQRRQSYLESYNYSVMPHCKSHADNIFLFRVCDTGICPHVTLRLGFQLPNH
jgi:hypothetical protein